MKKLNYFLLGLVAMGLTFTSCEDDGTESTEPPVLEVVEAAGFVINGAEIGASETFKIKVNGTANATSASALVSLDVKAVFNNQTAVDTTIDIDKQSTVAIDIEFTAPADAGTGLITFTLTDKKGESAEATVSLTFAAGLSSNGTEQLGAGDNTSLGSYYSVADDAVMNQAAAVASPNKVDFVFDVFGTDAKFFSPKNSTNDDINISGRTTLYAKASFDFASASVSDVNGVALSADEVVVSEGDVVVFETEDDIKGVFEVTSLTVAADGSVTIDIKVK